MAGLVPEGEDERSLALVHLGLEAALEEGLADGSEAAARAPPGHESGTTLEEGTKRGMVSMLAVASEVKGGQGDAPG